MNDNTKTIVALLAGMAAGAVLGLLFAPEAGSDTRDVLSASLTKLGDSIKETAAAEIDKLAGLKDQIMGSVKEKLSGTNNNVQDDLEHA
jgi:gas vesicle protein